MASARAALARAEATLNTATLNARRSDELVKIEAVSRQDNENAQAARQQAQADVAAARATLERTEINLAYAKIASPISGQDRQVERHARRAGHRQPGGRRSPPCSSSTRCTST